MTNEEIKEFLTSHGEYFEGDDVADAYEVGLRMAKEVLRLREKLSVALLILDTIAKDEQHYHCLGCKEVECDLVQLAREALKKIKGE